MRLHLIRHGQTYSNLRQALDTGEPGAELTPEGERQARAVGASFAGTPLDLVYASHLARAQATAAQVALPHELEVRVRPGLREILAGDVEMRTDEAAVRQYLGTMMAWATGDLDQVMPGAESGRQTLERFDAVVEEVLGTGADQVALVSHGAMIRFWALRQASNVDPQVAARWNLDNTGVVTLEGGPGAWQLIRWQDEVVPHASPASGDGPGGASAPA